MAYKLINSSTVIAKIENNHKVDYQDWHNRVPEWVLQAIADLDIFIELPVIKKCITVVDHIAELPCDVDLIRGVEHNGGTYYKYNCTKDNKIECVDKDIDLCIHFITVPFEYDNVRKISFPLIPYNETLLEGLQWYCLMRMLYQGWKSPILALDSRVDYLNPVTMWRLSLKGIRNALSVSDPHQREEISSILRTVITKLDVYNNYYFDTHHNL